MLEGVERTWEKVVDTAQLTLQRCADRECSRAVPSWLKILRRGIQIEDRWYCSPECVARALQVKLRSCIDEVQEKPRRLHRMPLGLLMLSRGFVNEDQVQSALLAQRRERRHKIGHWLQILGFATERQVVTALALQYATPVLAFPDEVVPQRVMPVVILKSLRIVPVRLSSLQQLLYIAFCSPVDHKLLRSIEKMTGWQTSACIVSDSCMNKLLEGTDEGDGGQAHYFGRVSSAEEMTRITLSYASKVSAREIRFANCGSLIWVRLNSEGKSSDLVFDPAIHPNQHIHTDPREDWAFSATQISGRH
jgi:hypothetical protein